MKSEEEIRLLLEKFYDGATTLEEEKVIDDFFKRNVGIPQDLKADMELFNALRNEKSEGEICVPDTLELELNNIIDRENVRILVKNTWWYCKRIISVAACIALVMSVALFRTQEETCEDVNVPYYTENDNVYIPQTEVEAAAEVSRALLLVADKFNQASDNVVYTSYNLDEPYY